MDELAANLASLRVLLRELPTSRAIDLPAAFVSEALAGLPLREALERGPDDPSAGAARVELELYGGDSAHVFARGRLRGWLEVACSRCVEPARVDIDETLAVTYLPKATYDERVGPDETAGWEPDGQDGEPGGDVGALAGLTDDDVDLYGYEGQEIDLDPLLREQIVLAVPYAPLCREDCKGLCPQCGQDRNHTTCRCEPPIDPRLAALRDINLPSSNR